MKVTTTRSRALRKPLHTLAINALLDELTVQPVIIDP
jgi:hypothetical protein